MKNLLPSLLVYFCLLQPNIGQIVCLQCFNQNDPISPDAVNRIQNGGFENTDCTPGWLDGSYCPNSGLYNCDIDEWTCTGGGTQSYPVIFDSTLCLIPEGQYAAYFGNGNAFVCIDLSFDTACIVREQCTVTGFPAGLPTTLPGYGGPEGVSLEQTVTGLTIGNTYVLEFWAGGEPLEDLLSAQGFFAIDVGFGKTYLTCNPTGDMFPTGTVYLIQFNATAESHTIKFTNWGHACIDCTELVIDNVRLYTLTELSKSVEDCMTGLEEQEDGSISVFPNPTPGLIQVEGIVMTDCSIKVMDIGGRLVEIDFMRNQIDMSLLVIGVYWLVIETPHARIVRKIIKL